MTEYHFSYRRWEENSMKNCKHKANIKNTRPTSLPLPLPSSGKVVIPGFISYIQAYRLTGQQDIKHKARHRQQMKRELEDFLYHYHGGVRIKAGSTTGKILSRIYW